MEYKSELIDTNFGKGVRIEKGRRSYEQVTCRDGLHTRIFKAPYERDGQLVDTGYHGVIFRQLFDDTDGDYKQFRMLSDRLQQASGEEVPNTKVRFMDYISHSGLKKELQRIGVTARINLRDKKIIPERVKDWLNSKGHWGGLVTDLAAYAGGFLFLSQFNFQEKKEDGTTRNMGAFAYMMHGIVAPIFEGIFGVFAAESSDTWCGPIHAIGFIPTKRFFRKRLENPDYMLNNFLQNYQRLDAMGSSVGNQKRFAKQSKLADRHFGVLEDLFPFTQHQKGFSIAYNSQNRDDIVNFFGYVLEGGNAPQLPNPQARVSKPKQEEKVEVKPVQTHFINPWEIEVPKIGGKKNE